MATSLSAGQLFLVEKQVLGTDCEKFRSLRPNAAWGDEAGLPDEHVPAKTGARRIRRNFPLEGGGFCFWKKKLAMSNFHALVAFMIISLVPFFSSFLQAGHGTFFLRRRKIQEKLATPLSGVPSRHNNGGKYRSNFFTAPCCFFPPSARASRRGPGHGKHLFTVRNFRKKEKHAHTQKNNTQLKFTEFTSFPELKPASSFVGLGRGVEKTPFRNRPVDRRRRFFRGHCSE